MSERGCSPGRAGITLHQTRTPCHLRTTRASAGKPQEVARLKGLAGLGGSSSSEGVAVPALVRRAEQMSPNALLPT